MKTNRELGKKEGEARGRKEKEVEIVKKLHSLNTPIEKIAEIVNISTEEVKQIIK
jgi:hypothetical protein